MIKYVKISTVNVLPVSMLSADRFSLIVFHQVIWRMPLILFFLLIGKAFEIHFI